jgi:hypothetical protein
MTTALHIPRFRNFGDGTDQRADTQNMISSLCIHFPHFLQRGYNIIGTSKCGVSRENNNCIFINMGKKHKS